MVCLVPRIGRPSACPFQKLLEKISWMRYSGLSTSIFSSSRMTPFSFSMSPSCKQRIAHQIGDHVEGFGQMLVEHLDVIADQFLRRERVEPAADRIDRPRDLLGRTVLGPLKHHVLDEMRDAALIDRLFARPRADPDSNGDAAHVRHLLRDHANAVRQDGAFNIADFDAWPCKLPVYHAKIGAMPQSIVGMELTDIQQALGSTEPAFRARQIYEAVYRRRVTDVAAISNLPKALREKLGADLPLGLPQIERRYDSTDGTRRYLLRLADGKTVETVWMPEGDRSTICISSQVGCPVDCKFCLTALLGLERHLTAGEIAGQVLRVAADNSLEANADRVNIVMMGQGEPLLNLANVIKATRLLTDPEGMAISPRRITLSTSGIIPKIDELAQEPVRPKLAISLNASNEEQRRELMPITRKYHLKELMDACRRVSAAAVGEIDLRICAAERRQRY